MAEKDLLPSKSLLSKLEQRLRRGYPRDADGMPDVDHPDHKEYEEVGQRLFAAGFTVDNKKLPLKEKEEKTNRFLNNSLIRKLTGEIEEEE